MEKFLQNINERFRKVNLILASSFNCSLSFEYCYVISQFYYDNQNTNRLIEEAERMVNEDLNKLKELAVSLKGESKKLIENLGKIENRDFQSIANGHHPPLYEKFRKAADELNPYWKRYCELNNRLDYLPLDSKEYNETEKECEKAKAEHDERQKEANKLYADYQHELKKSGDVSGLKISHVKALASRINAIAESILTDIDRIEKEATR